MKSSDERRAAIVTETSDFQAYKGSDQSRQFVRMLDALIDDHLADLATVKVEELRYKQGAIAQLQCLRSVMCSHSPHLSPKA